jgi:hypothetical protein
MAMSECMQAVGQIRSLGSGHLAAMAIIEATSGEKARFDAFRRDLYIVEGMAGLVEAEVSVSQIKNCVGPLFKLLSTFGFHNTNYPLMPETSGDIPLWDELSFQSRMIVAMICC